MMEKLHTSVCDIRDLRLADVKRTKIVKESLKGLILDANKVKRIGDVFRSEMTRALQDQDSSLQMENTYIPELPDGSEEGLFLALDIGGTNFRVILLELRLGKIVREELQHYHIADDYRVGCGLKLFDYLAECCAEFVRSKSLQHIPNLPLGFTFSFPMKHHGLDKGELVTWTKSFNCPNVVGKDVVHLLRESLKKQGIHNIDVVAILNDTTGTLVQGAAISKKTRIGIILGTGTNAAYLEKAKCVKHWEQERHGEHHVILDSEWGAFGDNGRLDFMKTAYDIEVDNTSLMRRSFTFEKHIGGKYLGELMRIAMKHLCDFGLLLVKANSDNFPGPWTFGTDNISQIELDAVNNSTCHTEETLEKLGYRFGTDYNEDDVQIVQYVAALISNRAARLLAVCTVELLHRMEDEVEEIAIAFDGSVYKHSPRIKLWIEKYIRELMPHKKFHMLLAQDGSGKGAAFVAAIAKKIREQNLKKSHNE